MPLIHKRLTVAFCDTIVALDVEHRFWFPSGTAFSNPLPDLFLIIPQNPFPRKGFAEQIGRRAIFYK